MKKSEGKNIKESITEIKENSIEKEKSYQDNNIYNNENLNKVKVNIKTNNKKDYQERKHIELSIKKANDVHIIEKKKDIKVKEKDEKNITLEEKTEKIIEVMEEQRRTKGIIFKSEKMIELVVEQMEKNGKMNSKMDKASKRKIAAKILIDKFMIEEMNFDKDEWNEIEFVKIHSGKRKDKSGNYNEVIYIEFKTINDVNKFTNQIKFGNENINDKICDFIKNEAFERFQAIDNIAWQLRQRGQKTKIHFGKHDFLLLSKTKDDKRKWTEIPPRIIDDIPEFKVGKLNKEDTIEDNKRRMINKNEEIKENEIRLNKKRKEEEKALLKSLEKMDIELDK